MKKYNASEIMRKAHAMAKELIGDYAARISYALRQVWAEVKSSSKKTTAEKLVEMGLRTWEKGGYKRIYINSETIKEVLDIRFDEGNVVSYGHEDILVDGESLWDAASKQSHFNLFAKSLEKDYAIVRSEAKLFFDCVSEKFSYNTRCTDSCEDFVIEKFVAKITA